MAGAEVIDALREKLRAFDAGKDAVIIKGLAVYGNMALRFAVTEGMITGGGKYAAVDAARVTVRTGRLRRAYSVYGPEKSGDGFSVGLQVDLDAAPYGAIQEFGGQTGPHVIEPRNVQALRWVAGGSVFFAKRVNHPGSRIPARPTMGPSLEATLDPGMAAVEQGLAAFGAQVLGAS